MDITPSTLAVAFTGFNTAFNKGFTKAPIFYRDIAMTVKSTTSAEHYGFLGDMPGIREWLGDRVINELSASSYIIRNRLFEETIAVKRTSLEDDQYGVYGPMFEKLGRDVAAHPDKLIWKLLEAGDRTLCYDGQYFFDADHPNGIGTHLKSVSNYQEGVDPAWYLMDCSQPLKPMIYQERLPFRMTEFNREDDDIVFMKDLYVFGSRGRSNVGYGFWQMAHKSKAPLTEVNYDKARVSMQRITTDGGEPLGIRPTHLIVPPELESTARRLVVAETVNGGETNTWAKTATVIVCPYL